MNATKKFEFRNDTKLAVNFSLWIGQARHHYINLESGKTGSIEPSHPDWNYKISTVTSVSNNFLCEVREVNVNDMNKFVRLETLSEGKDDEGRDRESHVLCVSIA